MDRNTTFVPFCDLALEHLAPAAKNPLELARFLVAATRRPISQSRQMDVLAISGGRQGCSDPCWSSDIARTSIWRLWLMGLLVAATMNRGSSKGFLAAGARCSSHKSQKGTHVVFISTPSEHYADINSVQVDLATSDRRRLVGATSFIGSGKYSDAFRNGRLARLLPNGAR